MHNLGANVVGISKDLPTKPSHYDSIGLNQKINTRKIDISNNLKFRNEIKKIKPDFIFHLAAQAIVKKSYTNSKDTWNSNLIGTINIYRGSSKN